jgi:hypothetical protein
VAKLTIPKRFREGVFKISQLEDPKIQEIVGVLNTLITFSGAKEEKVVAAVAAIPQANKSDSLKIAQALVSMYGVKAGSDVSLEEFVEDVGNAMESIEEIAFRIPEAEREQFEKKLLTLLSADAFTLISKAADLQTDDERNFCSARILTDLRPVFGPKIEDGPKGVVVVHLLKIGFHQSSQRNHDEFYVALDGDDLQTLKKVIERAESKAKVLKSSAGNMRFLLEQ